jgi:hypothetical protein
MRKIVHAVFKFEMGSDKVVQCYQAPACSRNTRLDRLIIDSEKATPRFESSPSPEFLFKHDVSSQGQGRIKPLVGNVKIDESLFPKTVVDSDKTMSPLVVFVELIDSPFPGKASLDVSYPSQAIILPPTSPTSNGNVTQFLNSIVDTTEIVHNQQVRLLSPHSCDLPKRQLQ